MKVFAGLAAIGVLVGCCKANTIYIRSVEDFMNLSQKVNIELQRFNGDTIILESDLDMTDVDDFEPIGSFITGKEEFCGIFDGNGHHIGNLTFESTSRITGIFGNTNGAVIRNLIVDDTCTFTNNFVLKSGAEANHSSTYVGGIVGYCVSSERNCEITNCISHANIFYTGLNTYFGAYVGGIIGMCRADQYNCSIKETMNTGYITAAGDASPRQNIVGGIIGGCNGVTDYGKKCTISYSINTGGIKYSGSSTRIVVGGIAGVCGISNSFSLCTVSDCVSDGIEEFSVTLKSGTKNLGGLVGLSTEGSYAKNSFWSQAVCTDAMGYSVAGSTINCVKYDGNIQLSTPWKINSDTLALTSSGLVIGLAKNDMLDTLKKWITSTYTISFVSNTYDKIKPRNMTFLESINVTEIVPQNPMDDMFGGWFVSELYIYQIPSPCVLRKDITVYGYWTTYTEEADYGTLPKPLQFILLFFVIINLLI